MDGDEAAALLRRRLDEHAQQWERSVDKFHRGDYHADDLVEDCFRAWGNALRDATAVATVLSQAIDPRRRPPASPRPRA